MEKKNIHIICGQGKGKSSAALGFGIQAASQGKQVIVVQFLKGYDEADNGFIKRLEPELKLISFERTNKYYCELTEEEKKEQKNNIINGINYAKKVIDIGECDLLILDEILGVIDYNIVNVQEVISLIKGSSDDMKIILTGRSMSDELKVYCSNIVEINNIEC